VPDELRVDVVEREDVIVMFKRVADEQPAITAGWAELERAVGSLRGRKFYGVFYDETLLNDQAEYHACVQVRDGDEPVELGLEVGTIPGGRYARVRLEGEPPAVYSLIAPTFEQLGERPDRDSRRPDIELYRRHDVIDLLLPVA
jgi:DNA gyrase inhibitor GyrI